MSNEFEKFGEISVVGSLLGRVAICVEAEAYMRVGIPLGRGRIAKKPEHFPKSLHMRQRKKAEHN